MNTQILKGKNMKELAKTFDLELPTHIMVVDKYELDGKCIVIKSVKVYDAENNFVTFADNERLIKTISEYPVKRQLVSIQLNLRRGERS